MATNWPIKSADLRKAITVDPGEDDENELTLFCEAACQRIDDYTGRNVEPTRHETDGKLPVIFILAARATAKLWWQQEKNGPRNRPSQGDDGPPAGIDLPRKVQGWLAPYPPRLFIADPEPTP